jgi:hypothetical protein
MDSGGNAVRVVKVKASNLIYAIAVCRDCGARWERYQSARACGRRHAKNYRHRVTVELGYSFTYDG